MEPEKKLLITMIMIFCFIMCGMVGWSWAKVFYEQDRPFVGKLVSECKALPWKYQPPKRPSCEDMANLKYHELLNSECLMCQLKENPNEQG